MEWSGERARRRSRGRSTLTAVWVVVALAAGCAGSAAPGVNAPHTAGGSAPDGAGAPARSAATESPTPTPISAEEALEVFDSAWTRVDRTYYDSTFRGLDWDAVRAELRPLARDAGTADSLRAILGDMLSRIGDSHFAVVAASAADALDPDSLVGGRGEPGYVGLELRVLDSLVVVSRVAPGGPAEAAGVRAGWALESISDRPTARLLEAIDEFGDDRRLAEARAAWAAEARAAGGVGDTLTLRFRDGGGEIVERTLVSTPRPGTPVRFGNLPVQYADLEYREVPLEDGCAGVIRFDVWMTTILPGFEEAFQALRHCDGLVLDLRGNPGGVAGMVMGISGYFMNESKPLGRMRTRQSELKLVSMPRRVTPTGETMVPYQGPVALLVDGQSMSTSEIFAGGLQAVGRARVFGEVTGGQALPALMARLPNRDVLMYVFADFVDPEGTRIEGRGVQPDQVVPRTRRDLLEGTDAPLEAALDWISGTSR